MNSHPGARIALLGTVLLAGMLPWALGGCGGESASAASLLSETFDAKRPIESGRLDGSLTLVGSGSAALSAPVSVRVSGPFQSGGSGTIPRFDLQAALSISGHTLHVGATFASHEFFLDVQGTPFVAPESAVKALEQAYSKASATSRSSGASTLSALGIDPRQWLVDPVQRGYADVGGVETVHLVASLNVARFLADANRLSAAGGALGLNGRREALTGAISPAEIDALAKAVRAAHVDVYTGRQDHLLRRLTVRASLDAGGSSGALQGLRTATVSLDLELSDLNRPQTIPTPSNPRPLSELFNALKQIGLLSGSSSQGSPSAAIGSSETSAESSSQSVSQAYVECTARAGKNVEALQRCASLLGG